MGKVQRYLKTTDTSYLFICIGLSVLSILTLSSVAQYGGLYLGGTLGNWKPAVTQVVAFVLGLGGAVVISLLNYRYLTQYWWLHTAVLWGLVLLTFIPGVAYAPGSSGSQSWISLPFGLSFQPTELAKISFCITFATHLAFTHDTLGNPKSIFPLLVHMLLPVAVVHFQGDDGTALVFLAMGLTMLVMAGLNRWVVFGCVAAGLASLPLLWRYVLGHYQKARILGLFNPEEYADTFMHQQLRGRVAAGAGGLLGNGLFQPDHYYVPRPENDFIFSYYAGSWGFIGCLLLLGLLFALLFKTLRTAYKAQDRAGSYICIGVFSLLFFQTLVNIGMNLMLFPVMGVTLPFVSAGGSSMVTLYGCIGLVLSVDRYRYPSLSHQI